MLSAKLKKKGGGGCFLMIPTRYLGENFENVEKERWSDGEDVGREEAETGEFSDSFSVACSVEM